MQNETNQWSIFLVKFTLLKQVKSQRCPVLNHKRPDFLASKFWILFSLCSLLKFSDFWVYPHSHKSSFLGLHHFDTDATHLPGAKLHVRLDMTYDYRSELGCRFSLNSAVNTLIFGLLCHKIINSILHKYCLFYKDLCFIKFSIYRNHVSLRIMVSVHRVIRLRLAAL